MKRAWPGAMSTPTGSGSPAGRGGSPGTPRGGRLRDRVNFFEQVWSEGRAASSEELFQEVDSGRRSVGRFRSPTAVRPASRASDSSFEESYERLIEEGELNGAKVVKFEKITVRKSVREVGPGGVAHHHRVLTESSRTPSEEHALEDSAYQSHSHGAPSHGSKSSSVTSFTRFPSEESLSQRRGSSPHQHLGPDDRTPSEWYAEFHSQSLHNASRIEYVRSKSEYDAHIAEIKGISALVSSSSLWGFFLPTFLLISGVAPGWRRGWDGALGWARLRVRLIRWIREISNRLGG